MPLGTSEDVPRVHELPAFIADAARHSRDLMRAEFELAKAELKYELRRTQGGAVALFGGAGMAGCASVVVVAFTADALGAKSSTLAFLGLGLGFAGALIAWWGQRRLSAPSLPRTRHAIGSPNGRKQQEQK